MKTPLEFVVDGPGARLDRYVTERAIDFSRAHVQKLIQDGFVTVNGAVSKPSYQVEAGDVIKLTVPEPKPTELLPQAMPLKVVYEDPDVLVIDKPPGLTVHPAPGHPDRTLVNAVLAMCPDLAGINDEVRPGIVHRLDKDTSGLIMVAKNEAAHHGLAAQIKEHSVKKVYLALVKGIVKPPSGVIRAPIGRNPGNRKKMAVVEGGREAVSRYRTLKSGKGYSLLEVTLETGRTHQIRVHLSAIGHPVVGDAVYGGKSDVLGRQFLHAHRLGFKQPRSGQYLEFVSDLPPDLVEALHYVGLGR